MGLSVKESRWGGKTVFEVATVEEAIELAQRLKAKGRYDWFRGQVQDWPPYSSSYRAQYGDDAAKWERVKLRQRLFAMWVAQVPELRYLLEPEHVHDFCAVIQHYGIPTHYIDFTTDPAVAGFFAADTQLPPSGECSCIYCLNTESLKQYWDALKDTDMFGDGAIELATIDVRNLWRLQAQRGAFVFANFNWDIFCPLDRIIFPYTRYPAYPTREQVYPRDKVR